MVGGNDTVARDLERDDRRVRREEDEFNGLVALVSLPEFMLDGHPVVISSLIDILPSPGGSYIGEIDYSPDSDRRQALIHQVYRDSETDPIYRLVVLHTCARIFKDQSGVSSVRSAAEEVLRNFYRTTEGRNYANRIQIAV